MAFEASFDKAYAETFAFIDRHADEIAPSAVVITYQRESYEAVIDEIRPLLTRHWDEIARNRDTIPLDPDLDKYRASAERGRLWIFTARSDGRLIGYALFFVGPHMHYRGATWALNDIFWLAPEHRGFAHGAALFQHAENALALAGVDIIHVTSKTAHPAAAVMLERLGYDLIEVGHAKRLGGD